MRYFIISVFAFFFAANSVFALSYSLIDQGDVLFYDTGPGLENPPVLVIRKSSPNSIKVRNVHTGETYFVTSSSLHTRDQISEIEAGRTVGTAVGVVAGAALLVCILGGCNEEE